MAKRALEAMLRTLELAPDILDDFITSIPADALPAVRGEGFWSIDEHVRHLAEVQPMLYHRLERFRDEERPSFVPYLPGSGREPKAEVTVTGMEEALRVFREWRSRTVDIAKRAPEALWAREGSHPEYTSYTALGLLRHIMMHDHWHMYRIEELWLTRDEYLTELE